MAVVVVVVVVVLVVIGIAGVVVVIKQKAGRKGGRQCEQDRVVARK